MREKRGSGFLIGEKNASGETKGENVDRSIGAKQLVGCERDARQKRLVDG